MLQKLHFVHCVRAPIHIHVCEQRVIDRTVDESLLVYFARCKQNQSSSAFILFLFYGFALLPPVSHLGRPWHVRTYVRMRSAASRTTRNSRRRRHTQYARCIKSAATRQNMKESLSRSLSLILSLASTSIYTVQVCTSLQVVHDMLSNILTSADML